MARATKLQHLQSWIQGAEQSLKCSLLAVSGGAGFGLAKTAGRMG
jgi:hypothetical protein